jgi:hypothetical protein
MKTNGTYRAVKMQVGYLDFPYEKDLTEEDFRWISHMASLAHWEDMNLMSEWIDLGGEG